jgi:hypothetical protein
MSTKHEQEELVVRLRSECPFCHKPLSENPSESIKVVGFIQIMQLSTCVDPTDESSIEVFGLIRRLKWPSQASAYVYAELKCLSCHLVYEDPHPAIPDDMARDLGEALICSGVGAYRATALMCRRILETFACEVVPNSRNLSHQIIELAKSGILSGASIHWAEQLRYFGNLAAHPQKQPALPHHMEAFSTRKGSWASLLVVLALMQALYIAEPSETCRHEGIFRTVWTKKNS